MTTSMGNIVMQSMGVLDVVSSGVLLLMHFDWIGWRLGFVMGMYLLIKTYAFREDLASWLDGFCAIWMFVVMLGVEFGLTFIVALYLFQKGLLSLL